MSTQDTDRSPDEDDVEGHLFHRPGIHHPAAGTEEEPDVEGHLFHRPGIHHPAAGTDDDDDVEGHGLSNYSRL